MKQTEFYTLMKQIWDTYSHKIMNFIMLCVLCAAVYLGVQKDEADKIFYSEVRSFIQEAGWHNQQKVYNLCLELNRIHTNLPEGKIDCSVYWGNNVN